MGAKLRRKGLGTTGRWSLPGMLICVLLLSALACTALACTAFAGEEQTAEAGPGRTFFLDGETDLNKYVGTYCDDANEITIWVSPEMHAGQAETQNEDQSGNYTIEPGVFFYVSGVISTPDAVWVHTDFYGVTGWIRWDGNAFYISENDLTLAEADSLCVAGLREPLKLYNDADEESALLATIPDGGTVQLLYAADGWANVLYDHTPGWIRMGKTRRLIEDGVYKTYPEIAKTPLLAEADGSASVLGDVPAGTSLYVDTLSNGFGRTVYNGTVGWVSVSSIHLVRDAGSLPAEGLEKPSDAAVAADWHANLLREDHGALGELKQNGSVPPAAETVLGVPEWRRKDIQSIYVLDTLTGMPGNAVDISADGSGNVMGWVGPDNTLYIAGNGGVKAPENCAALFAWFENAKTIDLMGNLHTDDTTDFKYMFYHCHNLEYLNLSGLNTGRVKNMAKMFVDCNALRELDFSSFNTANVKSFYAMFNKCRKLEKLDLTTFDTSKSKTFYMMFANCSSLREILWQSQRFSTGNAKSLQSMFENCSMLAYVDVSLFDMSKVETAVSMFSNCTSLTYIDVTGLQKNRPDMRRQDIFANSPLQALYGANGELVLAS